MGWYGLAQDTEQPDAPAALTPRVSLFLKIPGTHFCIIFILSKYAMSSADFQ
jgi:hypothetical protein